MMEGKMKKILLSLSVIIVLYILYLLIADYSLAVYKTKKIEIANAPQYVQDWINEIDEDKVHLCRGNRDKKMIIYLYIPNIKEGQQYKRYETINIGSNSRDKIEVSITYKHDSSPNQALIEIEAKQRAKYIILNEEVIDIKTIPIINIQD